MAIRVARSYDTSCAAELPVGYIPGKAYTSDPNFLLVTLAKNSGCFSRRRSRRDKAVDPSEPSFALYTCEASSAVYTRTFWHNSSSK